MRYSQIVARLGLAALWTMCACGGAGSNDSTGATGTRTPPPGYTDNSTSIKQTLESVATKHPDGKYVTYQEWRALSAAGAKSVDGPGLKPKDFYDGVGTTGIWTNGPGSCQCDNLSACNNMFTSYCYDDGSGICYTWHDSWGQTWGYCGCNCIL
jgi:hypothetical protein